MQWRILSHTQILVEPELVSAVSDFDGTDNENHQARLHVLEPHGTVSAVTGVRNRFHQAQQPYFCGCQWQVCVADEFHFPSRSCRSPEVLQSTRAHQPACRHPQGMPVSTVEGNGVHLRRQSAFHAPASHPPRAGGLQKVNHELGNQIIISTFVRRTKSSDFYN